MANLAEQLRAEIYQQCLENTKSFRARKDYVIEQIRSGQREVIFSLSKSYDENPCPVSREMLDAISVPKTYKLHKCKNLDGNGIYYRNGKHYIEVVLKDKEGLFPKILDTKEYCVEDEEGFWSVGYLYNRQELLDVGSYFENEGFRVTINLCSDHYARYPYKMDFFNICELIVSL